VVAESWPGERRLQRRHPAAVPADMETCRRVVSRFIENGGNRMLAYDFPLLGIFWSLVMFALFLLWVVIVIYCFVDNFKRRDHHGIAKALWFLFIVFLPIIGVFAYLVTRPVDPSLGADVI